VHADKTRAGRRNGHGFPGLRSPGGGAIYIRLSPWFMKVTIMICPR